MEKLELEHKKSQLSQVCSNCGKRFAPNAGSMTSWLFRDSRCSCPGAASSLLSDSLARNSSQPTTTLIAPKTIGQRYELLEQIGQGGMGAVFKAHDNQNSKTCAVKVLRSEFLDDKSAVERFKREASSMLGLDHPNLVKILDCGFADDSAPFLVMDYLEGPSLASVLTERGSLGVEEGLDLFVQLCDALSYMHENQILHRDLKPSNVILIGPATAPLAKILDFGLAKLLPESKNTAHTSQLTQTGELVGSPPYMSPEQCMGYELDSRSDIYSLACLMYHVLSGKLPFEGDNPVQIIIKHLQNEVTDFSKIGISVPESLCEIIMCCLSKSPDQRYESAHFLKEDLLRVKEGKKPAINATRHFRRKQQTKQRLRYAVPVLATLVLGGLAAAIAPKVTQPQVPPVSIQSQWRQCDREGQQAFDRGKINQSGELFQKSLSLASKLNDREFTIASLNELLDYYQAKNDKQEAKRILAQRNSLQQADRGVSQLLSELGLMLKQSQNGSETQLDLVKVRRLCGEAVDTALEVPLPEEIGTAEQLLLTAEQLCRKTLGSEDPLMARCLFGIAYIDHSRGAYAKAVVEYEQALALERTTLSRYDPFIASTLLSLGRASMQANASFAHAEEFLNQALEIDRKCFGPKSAQVAACKYHLALLYVHYGRIAEALAELRRAVSIYEQVKEVDQRKLANCYALLGQLSNDKNYCDKALSLFEDSLVKDYLSLCQVLIQEASLSIETEPQSALALLDRARAISKRFSQTDICLINSDLFQTQALASQKLGQTDLAAEQFRKALTLRENYYGKHSYAVIETLRLLSALYQKQGKSDLAEALYKRAFLELSTNKSFRPGSPLGNAVFLDYVHLLNKQGRQKEAAELAGKWREVKAGDPGV